MDPSETIKKLKEQAKQNSIRKLQSLFETTDEIEQMPKHLKRIDTKKVKL